MTGTYQRTLPIIDDTNRHFWTSGADGVLKILRCQACGYWIHPPGPVCPQCLDKALTPEVVSGKATLVTYTVNTQQWGPGMKVPYIIGIVELDEQEGLHLTTNLLNIEPESVKRGMRLQVTFEQDEDVWLPMFEPLAN